METAAPAGFVVPNLRIPKVLGVLNIVFASALLILGLCTSATVILTPALVSMMMEAQKKDADAAEAVRKQQLKDLEAAEKAAQTEEERQEIREQRKATAEAARVDPMAAIMDPAQMGFSDRRVQAWFVVESLSGILLNMLMLASGIGLVQFRPWGRSLGIWTAGAKVVRLLLVYLYAALVIVPIVSERLGKMTIQQFKAMGKPVPPGLSVEFYIQASYIMYTVLAMGMIVVGSIYPLVSLWLLSRPSVREACSGPKPPTEGN